MAPVRARLVTLKLELPVLVRVTVPTALVVPTDWLAKVRLAGERLTPAAALAPVPERPTVWGLPVALSAMLSAAVRAPLAAGVNITVILQLAPAPTELPQVLAWVKSLALAPVTARLVTLKPALPVLVSVTACVELEVPTDWLAKARLAGERLTPAAAVLAPVPERPTVWGLPLALSAMLIAAVRAPLAEGLKVTLMVQLAPAGTELPQVLV